MKFIQYDSIAVVLGGDHRQWEYRMVIHLSYQNKALILKVGHIDCIKDTRSVLKKTIGDKFKDGYKALYGNYMVINRV
jgi:hypothetical protein